LSVLSAGSVLSVLQFKAGWEGGAILFATFRR
jgi:hypothetical protein